MTHDAALDWQVDLNADNYSGVLRAVWVRPSDNNPGAPFGQGFDAIKLLEVPLGPDLSITPQNVALSCPYPQAGQLVNITARVRNSGDQDLSNVSVAFYLDQVAPPNQIGMAMIPFAGYHKLTTVSTPWQADGLPHQLIVVVDPMNVIHEDQ